MYIHLNKRWLEWKKIEIDQLDSKVTRYRERKPTMQSSDDIEVSRLHLRNENSMSNQEINQNKVVRYMSDILPNTHPFAEVHVILLD